MLLFIFLANKYLWIVAWVLQSIGYYFVLKKIGENPTYALIPFFAEWRLSKYLYCYIRSFFRPFLIALILIYAGVYMNPFRGMGRLLILVAGLIYLGFLFRLYAKLRKAFGRSILYSLLFIVFPPLFLFLVSLKPKQYFTGPSFKIGHPISMFFRRIKSAGYILGSIAEVVAIGAVVGFITVRKLPPRPLTNMILNDTYEKIKDVKGDGNIVSREDALGTNASIINEIQHSRDYFFPTHDKDEHVVVLGYIIGSNLENGIGLASANITQMKEVTTMGDNLSFVIQAGGSSRWFTRGIANDSYGRYVIENGTLTQAKILDSTLSMSTPEAFEDFLKWSKENYPADRYMLVLWDHGGGFSWGYGSDDLNKRTDGASLKVSELTKAIENVDMKFDMIGFDACLMQNIETALAFEPYADYYIASEEVEGGFGWFYTTAFGKLAQDPTTPTLDFAQELISSFDAYNIALKEGEVDTTSTLSIIDLTMIRPVYQKLEELFGYSHDAILNSSEYYGDISVAAKNAYEFNNKEQVDLIDYLTILDTLDYQDQICKENACLVIADMAKAMIPYRNKNSAQGINGVALTFPNSTMSAYTDVYKQLKYFDMNAQMDFYNNYFSIMAAQQKKVDSQDQSFMSTLASLGANYEDQEWYVQGFDDYETTDVFVDIPLTETEEGYIVELPEQIGKLIADVKISVYQKDGERLRDLGSDYIGFTNEEGKEIIGMDDTWVHINNNLISYQADQHRETDEGTIFTGTTKAKLNGDREVILQIEWEPTKDNAAPRSGKIVGYQFADDEEAYTSKGTNSLQSGDRLDFLFDYYDSEGKFLKSETYGRTLYITNTDRIVVEDKKLDSCDIVFFAKLTDIYQRELTTERVEYHVD